MVLVWARIFGFSLGTCCTQGLLLEMESLITTSHLPLFLYGVSEKSSSMMHMSSLACLCRGCGITPISKHIKLGTTCLGGRYVSSRARCLFQLGMVFPNLTPNLTISFISLLFQVRYIFRKSFPL